MSLWFWKLDCTLLSRRKSIVQWKENKSKTKFIHWILSSVVWLLCFFRSFFTENDLSLKSEFSLEIPNSLLWAYKHIKELGHYLNTSTVAQLVQDECRLGLFLFALFLLAWFISFCFLFTEHSVWFPQRTFSLWFVEECHDLVTLHCPALTVLRLH